MSKKLHVLPSHQPGPSFAYLVHRSGPALGNAIPPFPKDPPQLEGIADGPRVVDEDLVASLVLALLPPEECEPDEYFRLVEESRRRSCRRGLEIEDVLGLSSNSVELRSPLIHLLTSLAGVMQSGLFSNTRESEPDRFRVGDRGGVGPAPLGRNGLPSFALDCRIFLLSPVVRLSFSSSSSTWSLTLSSSWCWATSFPARRISSTWISSSRFTIIGSSEYNMRPGK